MYFITRNHSKKLDLNSSWLQLDVGNYAFGTLGLRPCFVYNHKWSLSPVPWRTKRPSLSRHRDTRRFSTGPNADFGDSDSEDEECGKSHVI